MEGSKINSNKKTSLIKEIEDLNKSRKYYKLQSEWHTMMYVLTLKLEMLNEFEYE